MLKLPLHLMSNKLNWFTLFILLLSSLHLIGQDCTFTLSGKVIDTGTQEPLEYVNIYVEETGDGVTTDTLGAFTLSNLCSGHYHLSVSHIGCESQRFHIDLIGNTEVIYELAHTDHVLHSVQITATSQPTETQFYESLSGQTISDQAEKTLANLIDAIPGVSSIKNGGIAKPVVHGLYGNRLAILNNGVTQAGQQWGNDHSPEIDPLIANKISVIKGVSALQYQDGNLGSVILVEPSAISKDPHLHGRASTYFNTNGRGIGVNLQLQKYQPSLSYKVNLTSKFSGDQHSPDYFLNNTGSREVNGALQLEKKFSEKWYSDVYLSLYTAQLGILRGSHISNLTDLESAFDRDVPFNTEDKFSYLIEAPRQAVNHYLAKLKQKYYIDDSRWFDFTLSGQINERKEYDIRRSGRTDTPSLSLNQTALTIDANYIAESSNNMTFKTGLQSRLIDNVNVPGTGILPLIPDYVATKSGVYGLVSRKSEHLVWEAGIRYDFVLQNVASISRTLPRSIVRDQNRYHNGAGSLGLTYSLSHALSLSLNTGLASRNPEINELYSFGLHQGVSGIEEGDLNLDSELSWKSTLSLNGDIADALYWEVLGYFHDFNGYIYLIPQDEIRLTIRGAFPVFKYEQTDARLYGFDSYVSYAFSQALEAKVSYSYLRGIEKQSGQSLLFIPSNTLQASLTYGLQKGIKLGRKELEYLSLDLDSKYVMRQSQIADDQDFLPVPDAYFLTHCKLSGDIQFGSYRLRSNLTVSNLFNTAYRDYLNRQRYFADDLGRSITFGVSVKF